MWRPENEASEAARRRAMISVSLGVAVALLIDATIVRAVLVPAGMKLLGKWNWYLPGWLSWLPDAHVEGAPPRMSHAS